MGFKENISDKLKHAMKAGDPVTVSCLRLILAAIKNRELEKRAELGDDEFTKLLATLAKQRAESIEMFKTGNRPDLVAKEEKELSIIKTFLPKELSEGELLTIIDEAIAETGAKSPKELGIVMKAVSQKVRGRADGKKVNELVKQRLTQS